MSEPSVSSNGPSSIRCC